MTEELNVTFDRLGRMICDCGGTVQGMGRDCGYGAMLYKCSRCEKKRWTGSLLEATS